MAGVYHCNRSFQACEAVMLFVNNAISRSITLDRKCFSPLSLVPSGSRRKGTYGPSRLPRRREDLRHAPLSRQRLGHAQAHTRGATLLFKSRAGSIRACKGCLGTPGGDQCKSQIGRHGVAEESNARRLAQYRPEAPCCTILECWTVTSVCDA